MIVPQKVEEAVEGQNSDLDGERMAQLSGLPACNPACNRDIAEVDVLGRSMAPGGSPTRPSGWAGRRK